MLSGLAFLLIAFTFFTFLYISSIFAQGIYKIYAINTPTANGAKIPNRFLNHSAICPILSTVLYTTITAIAKVNQYSHFVHIRVFFSIFSSFLFINFCFLHLFQVLLGNGHFPLFLSEFLLPLFFLLLNLKL